MFVCFVQALQFQRSLDDMEQCVGSVERELANEDCGSDLPSVNRLLKALLGLEEEVDGHRDRIQVHKVYLLFHCCCSEKEDVLEWFILFSDQLMWKYVYHSIYVMFFNVTGSGGNSEELPLSGKLPG